MENGGLRLLLHTPTQARYVKVQSLFDDRDAQFAPVNKAEFINQAKDLIDVYYFVTARQKEYQYDAGGNRSQATITERQAKQTNYQYYPNSNRLMTNGEYWNYRYDLLNRLISVEKNGKTIAAYSYNEKGLRVKKLAPEATTYYSFNQEGQVVYEQINETTLSYVYVLSRHFAMVEGENIYFYHTDHLGSTVLVTNNEGQDVWSNEYTPFGQLSVETGFFAHAIKFTGKDLDPDTGLYYFNARWYDPSLGRFISEDPIKDGLNWYTYVMNNPLNNIDPEGTTSLTAMIKLRKYSTTIESLAKQYDISKDVLESVVWNENKKRIIIHSGAEIIGIVRKGYASLGLAQMQQTTAAFLDTNPDPKDFIGISSESFEKTKTSIYESLSSKEKFELGWKLTFNDKENLEYAAKYLSFIQQITPEISDPEYLLSNYNRGPDSYYEPPNQYGESLNEHKNFGERLKYIWTNLFTPDPF